MTWTSSLTVSNGEGASRRNFSPSGCLLEAGSRGRVCVKLSERCNEHKQTFEDYQVFDYDTPEFRLADRGPVQLRVAGRGLLTFEVHLFLRHLILPLGYQYLKNS